MKPEALPAPEETEQVQVDNNNNEEMAVDELEEAFDIVECIERAAENELIVLTIVKIIDQEEAEQALFGPVGDSDVVEIPFNDIVRHYHKDSVIQMKHLIEYAYVSLLELVVFFDLNLFNSEAIEVIVDDLLNLYEVVFDSEIKFQQDQINYVCLHLDKPTFDSVLLILERINLDVDNNMLLVHDEHNTRSFEKVKLFIKYFQKLLKY